MESANERKRVLQLVKLAQQANDPEYRKWVREMHNDPEHQKLLLARLEEQKPGPGNSCKTEGCAGTVEKRVEGANSRGYFYKIPACSVCKRQYLHANNVPVTGMREFQKLMTQVYW
jgi:hypothetical protein